MSDNRKYYYLKLKENYFDDDSIVLLESMQDGVLYSNILLKQLELAGKEERTKLYFHQRLLNDTLPLTIGGGIGQSRLCMLYLKKAHIGEIQASIWPEDMREECARLGMQLI